MDRLKIRFFTKRSDPLSDSQGDLANEFFSRSHHSRSSHVRQTSNSHVNHLNHHEENSIEQSPSIDSYSQEAISDYSLPEVARQQTHSNTTHTYQHQANLQLPNSPSRHISGPTLPTKPESVSSSSLISSPSTVISSSASLTMNTHVHHTNAVSQNSGLIMNPPTSSTAWDNAQSHPRVSRLRSIIGSARTEYQKRFACLLLRPDLAIVQALCNSMLYEDEVNQISTCIVSLFQEQSLGLSLCQHILRAELAKAKDEGTLLRNKSAATLLCSAYVRLNCDKYLSILFKPLINQFLNAKITIEIDPKRMDPNEDQSRNLANLCRVTKRFLDDICDSIDICPRRLRQLTRILQEEVMRRFPNSTHTSMGGFFFLRFICPAIVTPEAFNLIDPSLKGALTQSARRSLVLVSKVLQSLTNGVPFGEKEDYMIPLNQFIHENSYRLNEFFALLTSVDMEEINVRNGNHVSKNTLLFLSECVHLHRPRVEEELNQFIEKEGPLDYDPFEIFSFVLSNKKKKKKLGSVHL